MAMDGLVRGQVVGVEEGLREASTVPVAVAPLLALAPLEALGRGEALALEEEVAEDFRLAVTS